MSNDSPLKIAIAGSTGRMGRMLIEAATQDPTVQLVAALEISGSPLLGSDVATLMGVPISLPVSADMNTALHHADCLIDFTRPEGTREHVQQCRAHKTAIVIGTTGLSDDDKEQIAQAAQHIPVVCSPNMAIGVQVIFKLLDMASRILAHDYDVEIIEAHHRHKIDAPSGTALRMGEIITRALGRDLSTEAIFGREGRVGERPRTQIGFATVRGGDIVGDHTALFAGEGERIEITHKAASRMPYARGALRAAHFLRHQRCGLFDMADVLNLA
jgi:4-hydroxy-tetrahydrodipicolinate reductase